MLAKNLREKVKGFFEFFLGKNLGVKAKGKISVDKISMFGDLIDDGFSESDQDDDKFSKFLFSVQ